MTVSYSWLGFTVPLTLAGLCVVVVSVKRLIAGHNAYLARVPVADSQEVLLDSAGPLLLHGEGPRGTRAFADLDYGLTSVEDGRPVPLSKILFKSSSSGISRSRLSLRSFEIETPGRYRLEITGVADAAARSDVDAAEIVITRDDRRKTVGVIVVLVLAAIGMLSGIGLSIAIFVMMRR